MPDFRNYSMSEPSIIPLYFSRSSRKLHTFLDGIKPFRRWNAACALFVIFMIRIILLQRWYFVMYALFVYHMRLFNLFLAPRIWKRWQSVIELSGSSGTLFPTRANEELIRPIIGRLLELEIWCSVVKSTLLAIFLTFFEFCDVPMYWQICVLYYSFVLLYPKKHQIMKVIKYKYLPNAYNKYKKYVHTRSSKGD